MAFCLTLKSVVLDIGLGETSEFVLTGSQWRLTSDPKTHSEDYGDTN